MKKRNRRQWKKLLSRVNDTQSFALFCNRYYGHTAWGNNGYDEDVEYASLWHGGNVLFCIAHNMETGEVRTVSKVARQSQWSRN